MLKKCHFWPFAVATLATGGRYGYIGKYRQTRQSIHSLVMWPWSELSQSLWWQTAWSCLVVFAQCEVPSKRYGIHFLIAPTHTHTSGNIKYFLSAAVRFFDVNATVRSVLPVLSANCGPSKQDCVASFSSPGIGFMTIMEFSRSLLYYDISPWKDCSSTRPCGAGPSRIVVMWCVSGRMPSALNTLRLEQAFVCSVSSLCQLALNDGMQVLIIR